MELVQESVFVTQEELSKVQEMNTDFTKAKTAIGDIELQKQNIIRHIDAMRKEFADHEQMLISKYGADSVINLQTGEVTQKPKTNDTK
jgi:hypothetical protein